MPGITLRPDGLRFAADLADFGRGSDVLAGRKVPAESARKQAVTGEQVTALNLAMGRFNRNAIALQKRRPALKRTELTLRSPAAALATPAATTASFSVQPTGLASAYRAEFDE